MANSGRIVAVLVACFAALYQFWVKEFVFTVLGVGRAVEPIENFPFTCRRIVHKQLEACEDLWLDENGRALYAACSGSIARSQWNQGMSKLNISGRRPEGSELMALYIDEPRKEGFRMHKLAPTESYTGAAGDGTLDLVGFDAEHVDASTLRFWLINQRPPVDHEGKYLDAVKLGANVTVDVFKHVKREKNMQHVKTIASPEIYSANGLALIGDDSFVLTNDHGGKVGFRKELDLILGGGNVVSCDKAGKCKPVTHNKLKFANGLVRGKDNRIYVPFAAQPYIGVYEQTSIGLKEIDRIVLGMPVDNLSVDSNGDIWAGGLTKVLEIMDAVVNPESGLSTSTIWRIRRTADGKYETKKVLEDGEKKFISGATTAVFDVPTGRLFIGGIPTPFLVVCDPK